MCATSLPRARAMKGVRRNLATLPGARCSADACAVEVRGMWLLATRSGYMLPWRDLVTACAQADIVIADRMLPRGCSPKWLKLDARALGPMGGALILVEPRKIIAGKDPRDRHPWVIGRRRAVPPKRGLRAAILYSISDACANFCPTVLHACVQKLARPRHALNDSGAAAPRDAPGYGPGSRHRAVAHRRCWPGRAGCGGPHGGNI